jgi:3-deoxy-D-manno-octulosonic-acid transferase
LRRTRESGARMALVNARLSETSVARWQARPDLARYLLEVFDLVLTQNATMAETMRDLGAPADRIAEGMNLKGLSDPLPIDQEALNAARAALGERPVWVASSTHPGEEREVLLAHKILLRDRPDLCLILAPRHPDRSAEVTALIAAEGMSFSRRSRGDLPAGQVFLADTMGELGNWYALSPIVFLGGSLNPVGGHNPFEVIQSDAAVLSGVHVAAFAETYAALEMGTAARLVADGEDLAAKVADWLDDPQALESARAAGARFIGNQTHKLDAVSDRIIAALDLRRHD